MALGPTYTLTVDLADFAGGDPVGVHVSVSMVDPRLLYPRGTPSETLYPTTQSRTTDASGQCTFRLLPSAQAGNYEVGLGSYSRAITMPAADARLSALGDAVPTGDVGVTAMDVRLARLVADLSADERDAILVKLGLTAHGVLGTPVFFGIGFPASPDRGDLFVFSADVALGLDWRDTDGTSVLRAAAVADVARYSGSAWVKLGNWRAAGGGSIRLGDGLEEVGSLTRVKLDGGTLARSSAGVKVADGGIGGAQLAASIGRDRGAWAGGRTYTVGDTARTNSASSVQAAYRNKVWRRKANGTSGASFDAAEAAAWDDLTGSGDTSEKASTADIDAVASTGTALSASLASRTMLEDTKFVTVRGVARLLQRVLKAATTTLRGTVLLARNEDVDALETDTSRVPSVARVKRLASRLYLGLGGGTLTGALTLDGAPTEDLHAATKAYVDEHATGGDTSGGGLRWPGLTDSRIDWPIP